MNSRTRLAIGAVALLVVALPSVAVGQDKATGKEVVAKVKEAASTLSKTGDLAPFNERHGPWVWKNTYIFIADCDKKVIVAQPINAARIGADIVTLKDAKGNQLFPEGFCEAARKPSGVWIGPYWWPKPGETEGSRKISYCLGAKGTPYVVGAGVYDDKATIAELSKLTKTK